MAPEIRCHYEILGVPLDADVATIKKRHRKLALKFHPDKNIGNDSAAEQFRFVQQAYEVLSDSKERKWYDEHRDAILAGWSAASGDDAVDMLFDVVHYMHPGCYSGYGDTDKNGYYQVFQQAFEQIVECERRQTEVLIALPTEFGDSTSEWSLVQNFYQTWESFGSQLNFAWEDKYNVHEDAPNRRVRRLMEDENRKARRTARRNYNQDILALVAFCKRRDPRVKAKQQELDQQKLEQAQQQQQEAAERKREQQKAKEAWMEQAQREMEEAEEADRLAGRVRLADLEDDYDYGGGKKRGKKKKNKRRAQQQQEEEEVEQQEEELQTQDEENQDASDEKAEEESDDPVNTSQVSETDDTEKDNGQENYAAENGQTSGEPAMTASLEENDSPEEGDMEEFSDDESEESEEPDVWRCECCRKDFKSEAQMENHLKSKKHKEKFKKYQAKQKKEDEILAQMMDDMDV